MLRTDVPILVKCEEMRTSSHVQHQVSCAPEESPRGVVLRTLKSKNPNRVQYQIRRSFSNSKSKGRDHTQVKSLNSALLGVQPANNPQDVIFKAYIHEDALSSDPEEWAAIISELGLSELGEPLKTPGLTAGGIGQMAHGWSTNGPKGDQKHYERQSLPGPKQESVREPVYNSDRERVDPSYTLKGGKNQRRLRDIDDGLNGHVESDGTRGAARKLYECMMSHLGFSQEDFLPGKREDLNAKRKAERTPAEVEAA